MLTRLRVRGFKNLVDFELRLGPVTCIAGPNGVGKSNIFDVIRFISLLADKPFIEAAHEIRGGGDISELFTSGGDQEMHLECDVLISPNGTDDFGQLAEASNTFLSYSVGLRLERQDELDVPHIRLTDESLTCITKGDAKDRLGFEHSDEWRASVLSPSARREPLISTERPKDDGEPLIRLHADSTRVEEEFKPSEFEAQRLPRTVLSSAQNASESRTAVLLRQEMRQWRLLQLEPSALRKADDYESPTRISPTGDHVPATLFELASAAQDPETVYCQIANRLAEVVDGVRKVWIEKDEKRRTLRFMLKERSGVVLPASSLSDGTLRFVALATMELDPHAAGLMCIEEPENGIHPERIAAMVSLIEDLAVDSFLAVDENNPLMQVVVSTHSPVVAALTPHDDLVFSFARRDTSGTSETVGLETMAVGGTWRTRLGCPTVAQGEILSFLGSVAAEIEDARTRLSQSVRLRVFGGKGERECGTRF
jgi:predicted ATPase